MTHQSSGMIKVSGAVALLVLCVGLGGLMRSCGPSADVVANTRFSYPYREATDTFIQHDENLYLVRHLDDGGQARLRRLITRKQFEGISLRSLPRPYPSDPPRYPQPEGRPDLYVISLVSPVRGCMVHVDSGDFAKEGGFFDPCSGAHFDGLGRVRKGPSSGNLYIPYVEFVGQDRVLFLDSPVDVLSARFR